jgi:hypothetical protein
MKLLKRCKKNSAPVVVAAIFLIFFFAALTSFINRAMTAETSLTDPLKVSGGLISGIAAGSGVHVYKGIPMPHRRWAACGGNRPNRWDTGTECERVRPTGLHVRSLTGEI